MSEYKIAPDLEQLLVACDDLTLKERNPRKGEVEALARLIKEVGFFVPLVYKTEPDPGDKKKTRRVVHIGNHRLKAVRSLGWEQVPAISGDHLTDEQMRVLAIADNRISDMATNDEELLVEELSEILDDVPDMFELTGYTEDDLDTLLNQAGLDMPEPGDADETSTVVFGYGVIVECDTAEQQAELLEQLMNDGWKVTART